MMKNARKEPGMVKCLDLIKKSACEWVWITGGEPLIVDDIEGVCKTIRSYEKKIGLTTNGTVNNQRVPEFIDRLGVSIDGDKKYHDEYRQGSFDKAVSYLKSMVGRVETVLMFTLFPENEQHVDYVKKLGMSLGVDNLQIEKGIA